MDLFNQAKPGYEPLASRMRPRNLDEYVGQEHILGPGRLLRRSVEADRLGSVLLSGPPGTGKTTLARVIAHVTKGAFLSLNAVLSGVKEIRDVISQAQETRRLLGRKTILFVDEVHRWNRSQQDALLPWVENGTFVLVGATTENPFFEVNSALVSRSRVFQLLPLTDHHLLKIAEQALVDPERGYGLFRVQWEPGALDHLVKMASGDARSLLNAVELAVETSVSPFPPPQDSLIEISLAAAEESIQKKAVLYDKDGDYHFDTISALIKSIRGSDTDAALYWASRMIRAGEDPDFLFRRLLISASEDVGMADPQALAVVMAASMTFQRVGLPEGQFALAQAVIYLATAPKSNSAMAYFDALKAQEAQVQEEVPSHLKDGSRDAKAWGHGTDYLYPHAFKDHWVAQNYLPTALSRQVFYHPSEQGFENSLRERVLRQRELQWAADSHTETAEALTWTAVKNTPWLSRLERGAESNETWRSALFAAAGLSRHHVVWVPADWNGLILLEALRQTPEGQVWPSLPDQKSQTALQDYLKFVPELNQPHWSATGWGTLPEDNPLPPWDAILAWGPLLPPDWEPPAQNKKLFIIDPEPNAGLLLTEWIPSGVLTNEEREALRLEEKTFVRTKSESPLREVWNLTPVTITDERRRLISQEEWALWWSENRTSGWVNWLQSQEQDWQKTLEKIRNNPPQGQVAWTRRWTLWQNTIKD